MFRTRRFHLHDGPLADREFIASKRTTTIDLIVHANAWYSTKNFYFAEEIEAYMQRDFFISRPNHGMNLYLTNYTIAEYLRRDDHHPYDLDFVQSYAFVVYICEVHHVHFRRGDPIATPEQLVCSRDLPLDQQEILTLPSTPTPVEIAKATNVKTQPHAE